MAILEGQLLKIQEEEVVKKSIRSERFLSKLGTSINELVKSSRFGIGDIVTSELDETSFQSSHGNDWVLCDGQNIEGSDLSNLIGLTTAPNLMGRFLRQHNPDNIGIDVGRNLNSFQADDNKNHAHFALSTEAGGAFKYPSVQHTLNSNSFPFSFIGNYRVGGSNAEPDTGTSGPVTGSPAPTTDTEARPENISFNFFIKIN